MDWLILLLALVCATYGHDFQKIPRNMTIEAYDCSQLQEKRILDLSTAAPCPEVKAWYQELEKKEVQIIESKQRDQMKVTNCKVRVSKYAQNCALLTQFTFGAKKAISFKDVVKVSAKECRRMRNHGYFIFQDGSVVTYNASFASDTGHYSADFVPPGYGKRYANGGCAGKELTIEGEFYDRHTLRYVIDIEITDKYIPYNSAKKTVEIDGKTVPISQRSRVTDTTTIWNSPRRVCSESVHEIYTGQSRHFKSNKDGIADMVLINNEETSQFIGLQLGESTTLCGKKVFTTKTNGIFVAFNDSSAWEVENLLEPEGNIY